MQVYYFVEIQTSGMAKITDELLADIVRTFGVDFRDYDEIESYRATLFFNSSVMPSNFRNTVRDLIMRNKDRIHYVDIVYHFETEINADRFVIWADGREQDYTGHMTFEED